MFQRPLKFLILTVLSLSGLQVVAQTSTVSNPLNGRENNPYNKYGIGELQNGNNTAVRGMADITSAYASPTQVNADNPASYSFLTRTTFEVGASGTTRSINGDINGNGISYRTGTASLSYLNIAFPIRKKGGIMFGFRPYSHVYYGLADTAFGSPIGTVINSYSGEGALNNAFVGGSIKFGGFSIGANLGYLFGNIRHTAASIPDDTLAYNNGYNGEFSDYTRFGGLQWKGGAMYEVKLDSSYTLRIGGTITISQGIKEKFESYHISSFNFGDTVVKDTVFNAGKQTGTLTLPLSYSIGIMLMHNEKWGVGIDYSASKWSGYSSTPNTVMDTNIAASSYKMSIGGEITPDINSISSYFSRATYRMGFYYGKDYLKINNTDIPFYGVTLGTSLPFKRSLSHIHLAMDIGSIGTTSNSLLKENYFKFTVGMSFNDLWFIKRRLE